MQIDLLHECSVSQTLRFLWIHCKLQAATECPSVTPVAMRQEVTEDQKICMTDFTIPTFHLLLLLTNKCKMHGTHTFKISTTYYYSDNTQATGGHN